MLRPLLHAVQFLTRIPVRVSGTASEQDVGRSLLFYPLVGLAIGGVLVAVWALTENVSPLLRAALLLAAWVALTGALHLDGLADSADAWLGGFGDRARTLAIMKDPYSGPAAVTVLMVVLIVKFAALESLLHDRRWIALLAAPLLGRAVVPLLFLTTPYVRPGGLGDALARHLPRTATVAVLMATALAIVATLGWWSVKILIVDLILFLILRQIMLRRIGGATGDTTGALVELTELATLLAMA